MKRHYLRYASFSLSFCDEGGSVDLPCYGACKVGQRARGQIHKFFENFQALGTRGLTDSRNQSASYGALH